MKINDYIKLKKTTYIKASEELGCNYATLYRWIHYGSMPRPAMLKKIKEWSNGAVTANDFAT